MDNKLTSFIRDNNIGPQSIDLEKLTFSFIEQMKQAIEGKRKGMMINAYINTDFEVKPNEKVIVIDAGGTNLRTCLVHFDENMKPVIEDFQKCSMPGIEKEVTAKEFFDYFARQVERLIDKADKIGWCFSYAAQILEDGDGIPIIMSKEIKAPEIIGKHIGKELLNALKARGNNIDGKKILIMNDTVTTMLAALADAKKNNCESCIGFILGTGTNTAFEKDKTVYNVESGEFEFISGPVEEQLINSTKDPSTQHFEKQISGAYLGTLAFMYANKAKEEGLLKSLAVSSADTIDMSNLLDNKPSAYDCLTEEDRVTAVTIFSELVNRAAKLTAANLASAVLISGCGEKRPVLINADGSTYYKTKGYREAIENYLVSYLETKGRKVEFIKIEDSPVIGSALGALTL